VLLPEQAEWNNLVSAIKGVKKKDTLGGGNKGSENTKLPATL
jgi:hypothetical protein